MGKNLQRVQDMLDGNYKSKIMVGEHSIKSSEHRKVGDKWTDSDGIEWEQKNGYRVRINNKIKVVRGGSRRSARAARERRSWRLIYQVGEFRRGVRCRSHRYR